jgi:hypothetical protein
MVFPPADANGNMRARPRPPYNVSHHSPPSFAPRPRGAGLLPTPNMPPQQPPGPGPRGFPPTRPPLNSYPPYGQQHHYAQAGSDPGPYMHERPDRLDRNDRIPDRMADPYRYAQGLGRRLTRGFLVYLYVRIRPVRTWAGVSSPSFKELVY